MEQLPIVAFDPEVHASPESDFEGQHVVSESIPLSRVRFNGDYDTLQTLYGERDADSCPQMSELDASPSAAPYIKGRDDRQVLSVPCNERSEVRSFYQTAKTYPVCGLKAKEQGFKSFSSKDDEDEMYRKVYCPFLYLAGLVTGEQDTQVEVVVEAFNPDEYSPHTVANVSNPYVYASDRESKSRNKRK